MREMAELRSTLAREGSLNMSAESFLVKCLTDDSFERRNNISFLAHKDPVPSRMLSLFY